jgi:oligopeptide transport system substrate-binding protein
VERVPAPIAPDGPAPGGETPRRRPGLGDLGTVALIVAMVATAVLAVVAVTPRRADDGLARPGGADAVVVGGAPAAWDPARIVDATSAQVLSQLYDGLTALDTDSLVRPAIAREWRVVDGGRLVEFRLRPGLVFSDGTPLGPADVRRSWLRVLDPVSPSPLADLLADVEGALDYRDGRGRAEEVGLEADGDTLRVRLARPAAYLPAIATAPTLAVVPEGLDRTARSPEAIPASGAYRVVEQASDRVRLEANPDHWAGPPALGSVALLTDAGGRSHVGLFQSEVADWTRISPADVPWVRYDRQLGPQLRRSADLAVDFVGFDASRPPFDDARVRRAVAQAVDWRRIGALSDPLADVATSIVPRGVPGHVAEDLLLRHDPEAARRELAAAGYPGGVGFPETTFATYGVGQPEAAVRELERELGIRIVVESRPFAEHSFLLDTDPPGMWSLSWSADYPHPHAFLGLLLRSDSRSNVGGWRDPRFDAAIDAAAASPEASEQARRYREALAIVRDEVPVIPLRSSVSWFLSRDGLAGAAPSGVGILRYAGLAWEDR